VQGLNVRDELTVNQRVHGEAARLVGEPDLADAELELRLDVRARGCEHGPCSESRGDRSVQVAGHDSAPTLPGSSLDS
jgi:hypothetical protein